MKAEIKKEFSTTQSRYFYTIYVEDRYRNCEYSLEEAMLTLEQIKHNILNPISPELVHQEEF